MNKTLRIDAIHAGAAFDLEEMMRLAATPPDTVRDRAMVDDEEDDDEEKCCSYTVMDGIGVYKISGPLLTSGNIFTRWMGYADYESVRNDLIAMGSDPAVQEILLLMSSPGGSVFGVTNAAEAVRKVNAIKPIYTYATSMCCSGAYWLAAPSTQILAAPEAQVGSIGVIVTHTSYEEQLKQDGVKVTVIKSDELKAVGGPYADLTEKERAHIQARVDTYSDMFHDHVQTSRPAVRLSSMKGQEFVGAEAVKMGLVDAVMSYDAAIEHIKAQRTTPTHQGGYNMKMNAETLRAALDAGKTLAEIGLTEEECAEILAATEPVLEGEASGEALPEIDGGAEQPMVSMPETDFTALNARVEAAEAAAATARAEADQAVADATAMKTIVAEVFNNRRVALGLSKLDVSAISLATLLSDFAATTEQFNQSFKIGGSLKPEPKQTPTSITDSVHAGLLQAAA